MTFMVSLKHPSRKEGRGIAEPSTANMMAIEVELWVRGVYLTLCCYLYLEIFITGSF